MKVQVEIAILEKSVLCGMVENIVERYMTGHKGNLLDKKELLKEISEELEAVKELNLISFYGISSFVQLDKHQLQPENLEGKKQ